MYDPRLAAAFDALGDEQDESWDDRNEDAFRIALDGRIVRSGTHHAYAPFGRNPPEEGHVAVRARRIRNKF